MSEVIEVVIGTLQGLLVFFLLFPGFFVERLQELFYPYERKDSFQKITNATFYTLILYIIYRFIALIPLITLNNLPFEIIKTEPYVIIRINELFILIILTFIVAILVRPTQTLLFRVLSLMKITNQTGAVNAWDATFKLIESGGKSRVAQVKLKDGTLLRGWIRTWSTPPSEPQLLISAESGIPMSITIPGSEQSELLEHDAILISDPKEIAWIRIENVPLE